MRFASSFTSALSPARHYRHAARLNGHARAIDLYKMITRRAAREQHDDRPRAAARQRASGEIFSTPEIIGNAQILQASTSQAEMISTV